MGTIRVGSTGTEGRMRQRKWGMGLEWDEGGLWDGGEARGLELPPPSGMWGAGALSEASRPTPRSLAGKDVLALGHSNASYSLDFTVYVTPAAQETPAGV